MKVRAKVSFGGVVSMTLGQERELPEDGVLRDLLTAGYVEPAEEEQPKEEEQPVKEEKPKEEEQPTEAVAVTGHLDKAQLEEMTVAQLKELANDMGLADGGRKAELIDRIAAVRVSAEGSDAE